MDATTRLSGKRRPADAASVDVRPVLGGEPAFILAFGMVAFNSSDAGKHDVGLFEGRLFESRRDSATCRERPPAE